MVQHRTLQLCCGTRAGTDRDQTELPSATGQRHLDGGPCLDLWFAQQEPMSRAQGSHNHVLGGHLLPATNLGQAELSPEVFIAQTEGCGSSC